MDCKAQPISLRHDSTISSSTQWICLRYVKIINTNKIVGANSGEEGWTGFGIPNFKCCTFRGSFSKISIATKQIVWKFSTVPDHNGDPNQYAGAGVWGSHGAIDEARGLIYITTGNNYRVPDSVQACYNANRNNPNVCASDPNNYPDSIIALRISDGTVAWSYKTTVDVWEASKAFDFQIAKDMDFSQGAILSKAGNVEVVFAAQKSGIVYCLNRDTGAIVWKKDMGGGNSGGGMVWGSAVDDTRFYGANANAGRVYIAMSNGQVCNGGFFFALNKDTGATIWSVCSPTTAQARSAVTVTKGGVVFYSTMDNDGHMYALNAATGQILWDYSVGASNAAGPSVVDGTVVWGSGYRKYNLGVPGNKMFAFDLVGGVSTNAPGPTTTTATPVETYPTNCWTCPPGGSVHWWLVPGTPKPWDRCTCVIPPPGWTMPAATTTTTTAAPTTTTTTLAPTTTTTTLAPLPAGQYRIVPTTSNVGFYIWNPAEITINVGETIVWDSLPSHNVYQTISADSLVAVPNGITSGANGVMFSQTFTSAMVLENTQYGGNKFFFRCGPHSTMFLTVIVNGVVVPTTTIAPTAAIPTYGTGYAGYCPATGYPSKILGMRYFVDALPIPAIAQKDAASTATLDVYTISATEFQYKIHTDIDAITVRGYNNMYPGPTIIANKGKQVKVNWKNNIPANSNFMKVQTIPAGLTTTRSVTHLHGIETTVASDGMPEYAVESGQTYTATYSNTQSPMMLWYHDHALGITRSNVYAGLAGLYLLKSPSESVMSALPTGANDIPLVIQDKILATDAQGKPYQYYPTAWSMSNNGQVILVNGKVWPYLQTTPTLYRFRVINASNSRFMYLTFSNPNMKFIVLANDQGYLSAPLVTTAIVLSPAERVDVLINFCGFEGQDILLMNQANAPYPSGVGYSATIGIDPCLSGRVMQFRVRGAVQTCKATPTTGLATVEKHPVMAVTTAQAVRTRELVLKMNNGMPLQGTRAANGVVTTYMYDDPPTETVKAGSVEIWKIYNLTPESHPVHIHTASFRILSRQGFDVAKFNAGQVVLKGTATNPNGWEAGPKDVARADPNSVLTLLVKFGTNTGRFMWHCHILEHEDMHMMRPLIIQP